ncbi:MULTISPECIES: transporter substrate-binding domain-containing protein [unclassified Modicisalibacter]|uniref:transporter substrate-binding domain-containing protein n=1 Tax=unclassified Modicisalibacter TaxID=2679913 RepID=UPI001CC91720|nr:MULTISPECIES: transporter substrate-binding domain-containing protein [unclassified Modicisalibacter]MBZ9557285.1 transporter substrate-binding domain-containing protein [Modicisalibacter sp. R2A 31.J]MBZ9574001.1 transporter substrate-binding domain-containing protein [Modicisalibacter sp. MOD 31.J]
MTTKTLIQTLTHTAGAAALILSATAALAEEPLRIGISAEPYPPFTYKNADGGWTGFEVELGQALCAQMQADCEIAPTGWSGIFPALDSGKIDMIMNSLSITDKRKRVIDFTDPYYYTPAAYVTAKGNDLQIPEGLDGKILGVQGSTTNATFARRKLADTGVELKIYDRQEQANRDLLAGRVDAILADKIAMTEFVKRDEAQDYEIRATAPHDPTFGDGVGIGLRQDDDTLRDKLNAAIASVMQDGQCASLSQKYFGTDICSD